MDRRVAAGAGDLEGEMRNWLIAIGLTAVVCAIMALLILGAIHTPIWVVRAVVLILAGLTVAAIKKELDTY